MFGCLGIGVEIIVGGDPVSGRKARLFMAHRVSERPAGIADEGVNCGHVYARVLAIKLALDCPVFAKPDSGNKVDTQIVCAELVL